MTYWETVQFNERPEDEIWFVVAVDETFIAMKKLLLWQQMPSCILLTDPL